MATYTGSDLRGSLGALIGLGITAKVAFKTIEMMENANKPYKKYTTKPKYKAKIYDWKF